MKNPGKKISIIPITIALAILMILFKKNYIKIFKINIFAQQFYNQELAYQLMTLLLALGMLWLVYLLGPENFRAFFNLGKINAPIKAVKSIGINPQEGENWLNLGINFTVIFSVVTFIVIYFQVVHGQNIQFNISMLFCGFLFAVINSFVEEIIFRFSIVAVLYKILPKQYIYLLSGLIFGGAHYFGIPGGIPGILMAGFIGWFLAKSIGETKGIFWAWLIHCAQDIIIYLGILISINS